MQSEPIKKKLVIVGDGNSGKTCLLMVFARNQFPEVYVPTVFDTMYKEMVVGNRIVELGLWDTAGQEDYDRLRPLCYQDANVVLITFPVDSQESFLSVQTKWLPEVRHFAKKVPYILVATKTDLRSDPTKLSSQITTKQGRNMAKQINATNYIECSAKNNDNVQEIFQIAAKLCVSGRSSQKKTKLCDIL